VDSKPSKGSVFQVYIPALAKEAIEKKTSADTKAALPTGTERILIVDDESSILAINQTFLERLGYTVTVTTESFWALEKIRSAPDKFDLVISDQTMPGLTGIELSKEILKIRPDMPISTNRLAMSIRQVIDES